MVLLGMALADLANIIQTWFLGYWAKQYEVPNAQVYVPKCVSPIFLTPHSAHTHACLDRYLAIYAIILLSGVTAYTTSYVTFVFGAIRASKKIHRMLTGSILGSTLRWLDSTPIGRVVSRFTQGIVL